MSDLELRKRQVEAQFADYEQAVREYAAFMDDWRERNDPTWRRLRRFKRAASKESTT